MPIPRRLFRRHSRCVAKGVRSPVESLESRVFLAAHPLGALKQSEVGARVSSKLLQLHDAVASGKDAIERATAEGYFVDDQGRVGVTIRAANVNAVTAALAPLGLSLLASRPDLHFAEGLLPVTALRAVSKVAAKTGQFGIRPTYRPITMSGSALSQADFVLEADRVRATLPGAFNGTGQRVGVLSDSYNRLGGAAADIASGDLPAGGVTVLEEASSGGTDEGRAMLQLIHDLAPASSLVFATANGGEQHFGDNIRRLANPADGNATVITDDVVYLTEPFFQDGVIAQAIDEVVTTRGVNYFTSAGNWANRAYESTTFTTSSDTITFPGGATLAGNFYDFNTGAGVDTRQRVTVPAGAQLVFSFQWDDPFYTTNGVDTDLDLYLINPATGLVVASAESNSIFFDEPIEIIGFTNTTGSPMQLDLAINRFAGPNPGRIKYINYGAGDINEFQAPAPTVIPHSAATHGQGVAAARYNDQTVVQSFSSLGPATILFSPTGSPIAAQTRNTPQITAIDGTDNTFFGVFDTEGNGKPNFFGTSAAAPHAAAVAALVRQANPGFTPAQVYQRMQQTADDIGAAGFDTLTGFGMINAFDAVYPTITPASLNFSEGFESGVLSSAWETRATGPGHIQVTTANGPFAGTRHLTLDASIQTGDGLSEVTLHVDASGAGTKTLSFRQREYDDDDHAMPASFTGSSNTDGVALSVNGTNWFRIVSLTGATSTNSYNLHTFDLSAIAAANSITLTADTRIRFQQFDNFPINTGDPLNSDGFAFDSISVTNALVQSATPGTPDLQAGSDTGTSNSDNRTNRDNSAPAKNLTFDVSGTLSGATVTIYADNVAIGSAVASGTTTAVTTNGTSDLLDGLQSITARQTEVGKTESVNSAALNVTIDTVAPTADVINVTPDPRTNGVSSVTITFDQAVANFDVTDLSLTRNGNGVALGGSQAPTSGDNVSFTVPNLLSLTSTSGTYVLTLNAGGSGITDLAGNALAVSASDTWVHSLPAWLSPASVATWNSQTKVLTVTGAATIIADPGSDLPVINASVGAAVLTINPASDLDVHVAALHLSNGATAAVLSLGGARTAANHRVLVVESDDLTIDASSMLDLADNDLVLDYDLPDDPIGGVRDLLASGYNFGGHDGPGIVSSTALNTDPFTFTLGYADNASLPVPYGTTFGGPLLPGGVDVDDTAIIVKFTWVGDVTLDGVFDFQDLSIFNGNYDSGATTGRLWTDGDLNFDGLIDFQDLSLFNGVYDPSKPAL